MNDLKIPNLNNRSKQYLFKNKIPLTRKPRIKLIQESLIMTCISFIIISINYAIPQKLKLFNSFVSNISNIISEILKVIGYTYEILLVIFILLSLMFAGILLIGAFYRIYKTFKRKSKKINF